MMVAVMSWTGALARPFNEDGRRYRRRRYDRTDFSRMKAREAIRACLLERQMPMSIGELEDALTAGGMQIADNPTNNYRVLTIGLADKSMFNRRGQMVGLAEWYEAEILSPDPSAVAA